MAPDTAARCAEPGGKNGWCDQPRPCPKHERDAEDRAACAWELTGALGLTVRVKGNDLVIDPDDVDHWWPPIRDRVVRAYRETIERER